MEDWFESEGDVHGYQGHQGVGGEQGYIESQVLGIQGDLLFLV
jgi:hypothetical protein